MIKDFLTIMWYVRGALLENFIIPGLEISYWDFCIYLAVIGLVATVLINSVRVSGSAGVKSRKDRIKRQENYSSKGGKK